MKKRPLCILCLTFLIIQGVLLLLTSGDELVKVPASSIFFKQKQMRNVLVQGQVYKKKNTSKIQILYLKNNSILEENKSYYDSNIIIYDDSFADVSIGQVVCVKGETREFERARNPGNFDQRLYYARQKIYGFLWGEKIISIEGKENILLENLYQLKVKWNETLVQNMGDDTGGILSAILLGEKADMEAETKELYQKNGMSHVLAISGLHISFICLGIYRSLRKVGMSYFVSGVVAVGVLSVYVAMIGVSVSVFRAYIMLLFRIGADLTGRVYDLLTALMVSAAMIVAYEPLYLTDAAFYMSYGAILGIVIVFPTLRKIFLKEYKWLESCLSSVAINLTLFPVLLLYYFEFPIYSFLINLFVLPLMVWVMGFGILGSIAFCIWEPFGILGLRICEFIFKIMEWIGEMGCRLPCSTITFGKPQLWKVGIYYAVLVLGVIMLRYLKKGKGYILLLFVLSTLLFVKYPNGKVEITMLDVGQGDCIYMRGPQGQHYLFDGGSSDVEQVGKYRIESFLKAQGVGTLDYVFISHGDLDHYSGIEEMIGRQLFGVNINTLIFPANYKQDEKLIKLASLAYENGVRVATIDSGQKILEGDLEIRCIQPNGENRAWEANANSMVLEVSFLEFAMLFTGDVEGEGEDILTRNVKGKAYDVLKVSHHGSKYSSSEKFLSSIQPRIALISSGENNFYGHPHVETLERLKKYSCKIYQTQKQGAITLETDGDLIDIFPSSI